MQNITVKQYLTQYNDFAKAGNAVYDFSAGVINGGDTLMFDMKDLDSVPTVFLNACFGHLIDQFGIEKVKKSFKFSNMLRSQLDRIIKYFSDYQELYAK